jgi:hypothetical protein
MNPKVAIYLGLAILVGFIAWLLFRPGHDDVCLKLLPQKSHVGFSIDGKTISVNIGGLQESTGANPEQIAGFVDCLKRKPDTNLVVSNGVIIPREPIGQLSNSWKSDQGLQVALEPPPNSPEENKVLQNLAIGPSAGTKTAVINQWCSVQARACVTCEPPQLTAASSQVIVRLKSQPPVDRRQMEGTYPPSPGNPHQPWEDVDDKGQRFYYECRRQ